MSRLLVALGLAAVQDVHAAKILMVLTSHDKLGEKEGNQTGWYLPEAAHPFSVFHEANVKMTWASPKGGEAPVDKGSVQTYTKGDQADKVCIDFMKRGKKGHHTWANTTKLSTVAGQHFDAVFVVGGYGVMWDLVGNSDLKKIVAKIYEDGGIVSGVCHGPAALVDVKVNNGSSLVKGKKVSCFTNEEEDAMGLKKTVPKTCEDSYNDAGANFTKGEPWSDHVTIAGRLITGQNPMSAKSAAEAVLEALKHGHHKNHGHHKKHGHHKNHSNKTEESKKLAKQSPAAAVADATTDTTEIEEEIEDKADLGFPMQGSTHSGSSSAFVTTAFGCVSVFGAAAVVRLRRNNGASPEYLSDAALLAEGPAE